MSAPGATPADPPAPTVTRRGLRGAFVTFEGVDGCGKTTQLERAAEALRARGHALCLTREPGGTAVGRALRAVLLDPAHAGLTPTTELLLYLADRVQHLAEVIRPALARGETVLCDRYHDATVAYQRHGRGLDFSPVADFIAAEIAPTRPDLTLWLDVAPEVARRRLQGRGGGTQESRLDNEAAEFHRRVREGYAALWRAEPDRLRRIDGDGHPDTVQAAVWAALEEYFDDL